MIVVNQCDPGSRNFAYLIGGNSSPPAKTQKDLEDGLLLGYLPL